MNRGKQDDAFFAGVPFDDLRGRHAFRFAGLQESRAMPVVIVNVAPHDRFMAVERHDVPPDALRIDPADGLQILVLVDVSEGIGVALLLVGGVIVRPALGHPLDGLEAAGVQGRPEGDVVDAGELLVDPLDERVLDGGRRQRPGGGVATEELFCRTFAEQGHSGPSRAMGTITEPS